MMGPQQLPAIGNTAFAQTNVVNSWFSGDVPGGNRSIAAVEQDGQGLDGDAGGHRDGNSQGADRNNGGGAGGGAGAGGFNGGPGIGMDGMGTRGGFGGGGSGRQFGTGTAGPLRLFQAELSGQASWFLPFVFVACVGMLASIRRRNLT